MRKDGGQYIAYAALNRSRNADPGFDLSSYVTFGPSLRYVEDSPLYLWQFNTYWSDRQVDWRFLEYRNVEVCHAFQQGELPDNEGNSEQYSFLLEKGYIRKTEEGYKFKCGLDRLSANAGSVEQGNAGFVRPVCACCRQALR
ncbi:hypothetical protein [Paenibacillus mesophilus]|uniref:hypothetical protein n=1 Tax=Paenibacillus mesophilus TaxID=2582849 RepID=UPI0013051955|nr:hypothetical protein [Paenibacillus mesophilus]